MSRQAWANLPRMMSLLPSLASRLLPSMMSPLLLLVLQLRLPWIHDASGATIWNDASSQHWTSPSALSL